MSRKNPEVPLFELRQEYEKFQRLSDEIQSKAMDNGAVKHGTFEEFFEANRVLIKHAPKEAVRIVNEAIRKIREQIRTVAQSQDISGLNKNPAELRAAVSQLRNEIAQRKGEQEAARGNGLRGSHKAWERFDALQKIVEKLQTDLKQAEADLAIAEMRG